MKLYAIYKLSLIIIVGTLLFGIVSWGYQVTYDLVKVMINGETLWMTRPEALELPDITNILWSGDVQTMYPLRSYHWLTYPVLGLGVVTLIYTKQVGKIPNPTVSDLVSFLKGVLVKHRKIFSFVIAVLLLVPMVMYSVVDHGMNNDQLYLYLFAYIGFIPIPYDYWYLAYPIVLLVFIAGYSISLKAIRVNGKELNSSCSTHDAI